MVRKNMLSIGIILLGLLISSIILGFAYNNTPTEADTMEISTPIQERSKFMIKIYDDKLALFRTTSDTPYNYLDTNISYLNDYDRELLTEGIIVDTEEELKSLIEDLTS